MNKSLFALALTLALGAVTTTSAQTAATATATATAQTMDQSQMNWFGGTTYSGAPALNVTAALVEAGGGASHFDFATALVAMLGQDTANAEVAKLTRQ